jgi:hypothetical protein
VKTYLQVHPEASITILESGSSLGGTWAYDRLYPGLKSNNLLGTYENPDFPMTPEVFGVKPGDHIPGKVIHEYLVQFAKKFNVLEKIRFSAKVEEVERNGDGRWIITDTGPGNSGQKSKKIVASKLILATGLTGNPNMPDIPGASEFGGPVYHAKDFFRNKSLLHTAKTVAVYGGSKSGWDAVYSYASAGVQVEWVMRESGRGPCWMTPMLVMGGKKWLEQLVFTRFLTWLNPTVWGANDGYGFWKRFLHRNFVGRWIVNKFWSSMEKDILDCNQFDSHPEMKKLKPWSGAFWCGTSLSILNYPTDFYDHVRSGLVRVHHGDITSLSPHHVHLSTGEELKVDALHCSTGWKHEPPIKFSPPSLAAMLGLPSDHDPSSAELEITSKVDAEIMSRFPILKKQPNVTPKRDPGKNITENEKTPYRLYRHIVPPEYAHNRNFAVVGALLTLGQPVVAQIQAMWIVDYLDDVLPLSKSVEEIKYETELFGRFGHWRFPSGYGGKVGDFVFETLPYYDDLLGDLGLKFKRKGGWLKEISEPYGPKDYEGTVKEWIEKRAVSKAF